MLDFSCLIVFELQMMGTVKSSEREKHWKHLRVFYATPQVGAVCKSVYQRYRFALQTFANDIRAGRLDPARIVLVVVDEGTRFIVNLLS
jgi:ERCC4-related helicase